MKSNEHKLTYELTYKDVVDILKIIDDSPCQELRLELGDFKLDVVKGQRDQSAVDSSRRRDPAESASLRSETRPIDRGAQVPPPDLIEKRKPAASLADRATSEDSLGIAVRSPLAGTFYRAPRPGAPPFVEVGSKVEAGDQVGIVEVMKLMNTIKAPQRGVIREICVENETMVKMGQVLMIMDPSSTTQ